MWQSKKGASYIGQGIIMIDHRIYTGKEENDMGIGIGDSEK